MSTRKRAVGSSIFVALIVVFAAMMIMALVQAAPSGQTTTIPITAPLTKSYSGTVPVLAAADIGGCASQAAGGVCDDILGVNLDTTLQAVNADIVNARQGIQVATDDASNADAKATAARNEAQAAQTTANANAVKIGTPDPRFTSLEDELVNARQGIQIATDDASHAQTTADGRQTANQVQDAIDISLAGFQEPGGNIVNGSIAEIKLAPAVVVKLNTTLPEYRPGVAPFRFEGSTRSAAVDAREEYYLGVVDVLPSLRTDFLVRLGVSRIRVTLDDSIPAQVGLAGNSWNLVLGADNPNPNVTIAPNTPGKSFTLGLPSAGISLDQLAADLDNNTRLNAEVVGNGSSLVNYTATWGPNPTVGSTTPFGNGGNTSTTPRTAWRAVYEGDSALVIVLDYADLEEYQHWNAADWQTVLTLVDAPLPIWSIGSSQNLFTGTSRTAAVAARDEYSLRNTGVTQATRLLPLGTSTSQGVRVTISADNGIGTAGNGWTLLSNGQAFAGSNSSLAYDTVNETVGVNYNSANLSAEELAHLFNVTPGFSAQLVGGISETAVGFIAAQIAGAFSGGVDAALNPRTVWIADYDNDSDQYITLSYGQTLERQVRRTSQWSTIDTIQTIKSTPAGVRLLTHPNASPGLNFQWWQNATNSAVGQSFIERIGGSIPVPQVGSQYLVIPATNSIVYFRVSDNTNTDLATLSHLVLPDGSRVASEATVTLGTQPITLTILANGRVVATRPTVGTTNLGLDAWIQ